MRTILMALIPACALVLTAPPLWAQTAAGLPTPAINSPQNLPIPQKIILSPGSQPGVITTDKPAYAPGQPITMKFTVSNTTKKSLDYNFATGQQYDFSVADTKGATVWTWSKGRMFTQALGRLSLAPGQKKVFSAVWNGRDAQGKAVSPGVYIINARLTSSNGPAITGSLLVNTDRDPNNMGMATRTPAETGAIRQVDVMPPITASKQITIGTPATNTPPKPR
jgi:hypothetical protein